MLAVIVALAVGMSLPVMVKYATSPTGSGKVHYLVPLKVHHSAMEAASKAGMAQSFSATLRHGAKVDHKMGPVRQDVNTRNPLLRDNPPLRNSILSGEQI